MICNKCHHDLKQKQDYYICDEGCDFDICPDCFNWNPKHVKNDNDNDQNKVN